MAKELKINPDFLDQLGKPYDISKYGLPSPTFVKTYIDAVAEELDIDKEFVEGYMERFTKAKESKNLQEKLIKILEPIVKKQMREKNG